MWDQTAESVRNTESGRCWRGKPTQRSRNFMSSKGIQTSWKVSYSSFRKQWVSSENCSGPEQVALGFTLCLSHSLWVCEKRLLFYRIPSGLATKSTFCRAREEKETTRCCGETLKSTLRMREFDRMACHFCYLTIRNTSKSRPASPGKTTQRTS
jgi:hypothetical protein